MEQPIFHIFHTHHLTKAVGAGRIPIIVNHPETFDTNMLLGRFAKKYELFIKMHVTLQAAQKRGEIIGMPASGHATGSSLKMNGPEIVAPRGPWISAGGHLPMD